MQGGAMNGSGGRSVRESEESKTSRGNRFSRLLILFLVLAVVAGSWWLMESVDDGSVPQRTPVVIDTADVAPDPTEEEKEGGADQVEDREQGDTEREASAWRAAVSADTARSYKEYIRVYPSGEYVSEARSRIEEIAEENRKVAARANLPAEVRELERNMVRISGGTFIMGCTSEQRGCYNNEYPAHEVSLASFQIGKYEVTQTQWEAVMGENPSKFSGCSRCPVEQVSWNDVQEFIEKLNTLTGKDYRLPTEAEWEYAARGDEGYEYSGSNNVDRVAWYGGRKTHPVGKKSANGYGLYEMSGNVLEWCSDWYASDYYESSPGRNPTGPATDSMRVIRGGSWYYNAKYCRVANRARYPPDNGIRFLGFRLAL